MCADSVYELESSLKGNPFNIESIDNAFHPPNTHQPLWVDVLYYYNTTDQLLPLHPASYQARNNSITPNYHFRWVITPLFLPLGPEAIELLSGALISLESVTLYIVVQPVCGEDEQHHRDLLNKLTRKVHVCTDLIHPALNCMMHTLARVGIVLCVCVCKIAV